MSESDPNQLNIIDYIEESHKRDRQVQELIRSTEELSETISEEITHQAHISHGKSSQLSRLRSLLGHYDQLLKRLTRQKKVLLIENQQLRKMALSKPTKVKLISDNSDNEEFLKLKEENKILREGLESSQKSSLEKQNAYRDLSIEFEKLRVKNETLKSELAQKEKDYRKNVKDLEEMMESSQHDYVARAKQSDSGKKDLESQLDQQKKFLGGFSEEILDLMNHLNQLEKIKISQNKQISIDESLPIDQQEILHQISQEINRSIDHTHNLEMSIKKMTQKIFSDLRNWNEDLLKELE